MKLIQLTITILMILSCSKTFSQSIYFNLEDGNNYNYKLIDVQKITFNDVIMNIHFFDGSQFSINVSTLNNFQYAELLEVNKILDQFNETNILLYPNPTSDELNIKLRNKEQATYSLVIYDSSGKLVFQKESNKEIENISLNNFKSDNYILKIQFNNQYITKSFTKQ